MSVRHRLLRSRRQNRIVHDTGGVGRIIGPALLVAALFPTLITTGVDRSADSSVVPGAQIGVTDQSPARSPVIPVAIRIPTLDVDSLLVPVEIDRAGTLKPPHATDVAGWYTGSAVPGDAGPAVIAGHLDSLTGPGVFVGLSTLEPGDEVAVVRSDGRTVTFRVWSTETFHKDRFPTESVYGPTPVAELRLITCGGRFDDSTELYLDNVIVHAGPV